MSNMSKTKGKTKIDKYITDMKEFPSKPVSNSDNQEKPSVANDINSDLTSKSEASNLVSEKKTIMHEVEENSKIFSLKEILVGIVDLLALIVLIFLLIKLPEKSNELRTGKINEMKLHLGSFPNFL